MEGASHGRNFRIQLALMAITICFGVFFRISLAEWSRIFICSGVVLSAEAINTAIELLVDKVLVLFRKKTFWDKDAKKIKDLAAGAVLISSIMAAVNGGIIFIPKIRALFLS